MLIVKLAKLELLLHNDRTIFWFDNCSAKKVWSAVEYLIIVIVDIENKWRITFKIILIEDFVVKLQALVEERVIVVFYHGGLLYCCANVPAFDERIGGSIGVS